MTYTTEKSRSVAGRIAERRRQEVEAPRLLSVVPELASLNIQVTEISATARSTHRKHVAVQGAPALFIIPCGDERCDNGGHDITRDVLRVLRLRLAKSTGTHTCDGMTGSAPCTRTIEYELNAAYNAGS